ncbi:hypothetical protein [Algisphaera agarilytica]|uniref:Secreted protein n=1 Tax=Algisphaera agarilytica TaxID=1385975 RepID=A0A7X0HAJ8_9BACT|nr:hypothetical protein [Algisphaera agarilytica]MBB6430839.1 hypothetical protein [Algisphaera agarilytica]
MPKHPACYCLSLTLSLLASGSAVAQNASSPRELIDNLIAEREAAPSEAPTSSPAIETIPNRVGVPASAVDLDASVIGVLPGAPLPKLRREGEFIIERPGELLSVEDGTFWVFAFDPVSGQPDLRPMIVQKCQRLASMQDTIEQRRGDDLGFSLTGQVHTYRGVNYLLPTGIAGTRKLPPGTRVENEEADAKPAAPIETELDVTSPEATFESAGGDGGAPDPIELMESLLDERGEAPTRPDTSPVASPVDIELDEVLQGIKPKTKGEEKLLREGVYLVNRSGRLIRGLGGSFGGEASNVMFAFEADGNDPESAEAPMLIMPCKLLELMEDQVVELGDEVVFVVSGRVYTYRGANYLMPSTMRLEYDLGNLNP